MSQPTIYQLALEIAKSQGWRNVTRGPLYRLARERGLVGSTQLEATWCKNNLRGNNSMARIRAALSREPGLTGGEPSGSKSPAWKDLNRQTILDKAFELAQSQGLMVSRAVIAEAAGVSPGTVSGMWGGMAELRSAVIARAREKGVEKILHQAAALGLT